jgi:SNF2 family DNA or RNA helicase
VITLTAINELIYNYFEIKRVLVIAPLRVADTVWEQETRKWDHLKHLKVSRILGSVKQRLTGLEQQADVYLINRENVSWLIEQFGAYKNKARRTGFQFKQRFPFDMVVVDELSSFKSPGAIRFKMLKKARPFMKRIVGLTGTPAPNGLLDLWSQIYLLDRGVRLGETITGYRERYFEAAAYVRNTHGELVPSSYAPKPGAQEKIHQLLSDLCISMRNADWLDLPDILYRVVQVKLDTKTLMRYIQLEKQLITEIAGEVIVANTAATVIGKLQQFAQGAAYTEDAWVKVHDAKLDALEELNEEANGNPVLVFYWYKHDLARLQERFPEARVLKEAEDVNAWNRGDISMLFAHPASAGHGLNLQAGGNIIIWFGLTWSLELYQQANARLHRQGQKKAVIIHHLVSEGTVDEDIMRALKHKEEGQNALMQAVKARIEKYRGQEVEK